MNAREETIFVIFRWNKIVELENCSNSSLRKINTTFLQKYSLKLYTKSNQFNQNQKIVRTFFS